MVGNVKSFDSFLFVSGGLDQDDVRIVLVSSVKNSDAFALGLDSYNSGTESKEGISNVTNVRPNVETQLSSGHEL
jgi:hypothetical protein